MEEKINKIVNSLKRTDMLRYGIWEFYYDMVVYLIYNDLISDTLAIVLIDKLIKIEIPGIMEDKLTKMQKSELLLKIKENIENKYETINRYFDNESLRLKLQSYL